MKVYHFFEKIKKKSGEKSYYAVIVLKFKVNNKQNS